MTHGRWLLAIALAVALTGSLPRAQATFGADTTASASFGAGVWEPPLPGLTWWLDAGTPATLFQLSNCTTAVTTASDPVGCWTDRRAGHSAITLPFGLAGPTWSGQVRNGRRTVHFGDGQVLSGPDLFGGSITNAHIFVVVRAPTYTYNSVLSLNGPNSSDTPGQSTSRFSAHMPWANGVWYFDAGGNTGTRVQTSSYVTPDGAWTLFEGSKDGLTPRNAMVLNDHISPSPAGYSPSAASQGGLMVGDNTGNWSITISADHDIAEILVYDRVLSAGEVDQAVAYLTTKWGSWP